MSSPHALPGPGPDRTSEIRGGFARANAMLARTVPILRHLLSTPDASLFSDEIVARVRGMINDIAGQILRAQAEATGHAAREVFAERHGEALAARLQTSAALIAHCHALAVEWQVTMRLEASNGIDPVLSPLIQTLIASRDSAEVSTAMAALAAQARFAQAQRRMELPLIELPADLFHEVLLGWRAYAGEARSDAMIRAEAKLRNAFDESAGRLSLFAKLMAQIRENAGEALSLERAGVAFFFTAIAAQSGQSRELAVLSSNKQQVARLALGLRASGQQPEQIARQLLTLHPDSPPSDVGDIAEDEARRLLAEGGAEGQG